VLTISPLRDEDIPAVLEIEKLSFSAPKNESIFKSERSNYLVAKEADRVVGFIGHEKIADETHIINMAVHPENRKQGIGKRLLEMVLNDQDVFFLEVRASNLPAQRLYEKYGFNKVGTRKNYYSDNGEDALIMRREPIG
jgi:ribosomal-protein-alanine N-acetyltransferase